MATDDRSAGDADDAQRPCAPCRGTGRLISNLGGEPHEVACPWCEGTGHFLAGHDAQSRFRGDGASAAGRTV